MSTKAVVVAIVFYYLASMMLMFAISIAWGVFLVPSGVEPVEFEAAFSSSLFIRVSALAIGVLCSAAAGYLATYIAKSGKFNEAIIIGIFFTVVGAVFIILEPEAAPLWSQVLSMLLYLPAAVVGGLLYSRKGVKAT